MSWVRRFVQGVAVLAALMAVSCQSTVEPSPTTAGPSAPAANVAAPLFYSKGGSLYVSAPAGSPGRKLTDGPFDAQPAPSPDLAHVAFVRKADVADYGGELWVLDLSPELTPAGPPRRLVDPADLPKSHNGMSPSIAFPRWSPAGGQIAFLDSPHNGFVPGGILMVAAADTGALQPRQLAPGAEWAPFADDDFAWSPDGSHLAWINERSDVRPVNVNILAAVGGKYAAAVKDTNASSVIYAKDGQSILFLNGEAPPDFVSPFAVHTGGIYSVATPGGAGTNPPSAPVLVFIRQGSYYGHVTTLEFGGFAFTAPGTTQESQIVQVLDEGSSVPRTVVTDVAVTPICHTSPGGAGSCHGVQPPLWGSGDLLAYLNTSTERALVVTGADNRSPRQVDTGVESFGWAP